LGRSGVVLHLVVTSLDKVANASDGLRKDLFSTKLWSIVMESRVIGNHFKDLVDLGFKGLKYLG